MTEQYDIAIIGGGINGAGIARDAALRGRKVILLEKNDFGSGTSSWSSRLIHGGLRYLEYGEIPLVFESLHERRRLRELASHLVTRLRLVIPVYKDSRRGRILIRLGMIAYDLLSIGKKTPRHHMLGRKALLREEPGLLADGLVGGAAYFDAQVTYAERLVLENVIAAQEAGAEVRNYSPVSGITLGQGAMHHLQFRDVTTGEVNTVAARVIVNAAGPWVDRVLATVNHDLGDLMGGTKGSHIVVAPFAGAPSDAFYVEAKSDGRPFFIIPWNEQYLIGTTDIRYDGDPADAIPSAAEIDYLLDETNRVFPQAKLDKQDIHYAYAGVRPLPKRKRGPESAITRKHIIYEHLDSARGLISIVGGKLTTYRSLAEQAANAADRLAGHRPTPGLTRDAPLPGGVAVDAARKALEGAEISAACATRLISIYGSRALAIVAKAKETGALGFLDAAETMLTAEVGHAIREEFAITLVDIVHRRLMAGLMPDQGASVADAIAVGAGAVAGWSDARLMQERAALVAYNERLQPG